MMRMTYDRDADAAYIYVAEGKVAGTEEAGPFLYDVDANGKILGIEILSCTRVLAPGDWATAPSPQSVQADAAE
jgi:uncharacterized protein YuzE